MLLNTKQLIGLPVITRSQERVGKVGSFDIDVMTGRIAVMHVLASGLVARLSEDQLLVPWHAIFEMTSEYVIIVDGAIQAPTTALASSMTPASPSGTACMQKDGICLS